MQGQPIVHNVSVMSKARKIPEGKQLYSYMYGIQQLHVITSKTWLYKTEYNVQDRD